MKADLFMKDNGHLLVKISGVSSNKWMGQWGLIPEGAHGPNPWLALYSVVPYSDDPVFSKELNKKGKEQAQMIMESIVNHEKYMAELHEKEYPVHVNKRKAKAAITKIHQKILEWDPK